MNIKTDASAPSTAVHWLVLLFVVPLVLGPALAVIAAQAAAGGEWLTAVPMWAWVLAGAGYLACVVFAWRRGVLASLPAMSLRPVVIVAVAAASAGAVLALGGHLDSASIPSLVAEKNSSVPEPGTTGALAESIVDIMPVIIGLMLLCGVILIALQINNRKK